MAFFDRFLPTTGDNRIQVHAFMSALGELERGKVTLQTIFDAFNIVASEQADANALIAKIVTPQESLAFTGRQLLTNIGTTAVVIGLVAVQGAGITGLDWHVALNRNGSAGTLTFDLVDATASIVSPTVISTITDTTGAGNKVVTATHTPGAPLSAGVRRLGVSARSSTATDDPIVLGCGALARRVELLTADVLHQILLLAESGTAYATDVTLKARLGIA